MCTIDLTGRIGCEASEWGMSSRIPCEAVAPAVENLVIAEKSQIAVRAQKQAVNTGMSFFVILRRPGFTLLCFWFVHVHVCVI